MEQVVAEFLDEHLYPNKFSNSHRAVDAEQQRHGVDVRADLVKGQGLLIDEKSALNYVRDDLREDALPTFVFEVSFLHQGREVPGWLFDPGKQTDHYLLCWLWAKKKKSFDASEILRLEAYLIARRAVQDYLAEHGITQQNLPKLNHDIRSSQQHGPHMKDKYRSKGFYFFFSLLNYEKKPLPEQPINIVVYRHTLAKLATKRFGVGAPRQHQAEED